ncbi:hypothetical protein LCGC14_1326320 [marine sediment metagenome]|uniref:Uncharacterized protein n=1 Tax=marine sediment metagenome TaxID=412755 RepID=A0A0F9MZ09_9ZZZZ|nr:hypothetical protein [Methylophaga sp.]HEC58526.1 hypothetical protein [Methylophaga sp.]
MPANNNLRSEQLLALLGQQLVYQQRQCEIIELLDDCKLVLQVLQSDSNIQANQYGEGHRTVPTTYTLPVFDGEGELHPELVIAGLQRLLISI